MSRHSRRRHAALLVKVKAYTRKLAEWVKDGTKKYPDPVDAALAYERAGFGPPPVSYEEYAHMIAPSRPKTHEGVQVHMNAPVSVPTNDERRKVFEVQRVAATPITTEPE